MIIDTHFGRRLVLSCAAGALLVTTGAQAQQVEASASGSSDDILVIGRSDLLDSPISAGSRLNLTPLETPASISVIDGDAIRMRGDISVVEAVTRAPGITSIANPGNGGTALAARGFAGQGSVLQLVDGVRLFPGAGTITFPSDPWNIERIEVLSGPASVLYGQGALGGAINVVTKKPNRERMELAAEVGYGSQDSWHLAGGAGGPLGEKFAFRLDASYRQSDGYVERGDSDNLALSAALGFYPSEDLSIVLRNDYGNLHPAKYFGTPLVNSRLDTSIRDNNYNVTGGIMQWKDNRTLLTLDWSASEAMSVSNTVYYLTSDRRWRNAESYCWIDSAGDCPNGVGGGTPGRVYRTDYFGIRHDQEQIGNVGSVTVKTPLGGSVSNDLVVGFDFNRIKLVYSHDFPPDAPFIEDEIDLRNPIAGVYQGVPTIPRRRHRTTEYSFFAEDRLELSEQFSIVGGIRHERDKVQRFNFVYNADGTVTEVNAFASLGETARIFNNTTWRVGAVYQPTPQVSIYGQYSTGVDPIGTLVTLSAGDFNYANATGDQIEGGVKASFLNGRGQATFAAYKIVKKNLVAQRTPTSPVEQIGQRSAKGIEASLTLALPGEFTIDANGTILDADFDAFINGGDDFGGNTPPGVAEKAANLWLTWSSIKDVRAQAGLRYVGRRFSDNANAFRVPAYTVIDAGVSYAVTENVAVDLRAYNLFDKDYAITTYNDEQWILGRPRSFDVSVRARF